MVRQSSVEFVNQDSSGKHGHRFVKGSDVPKPPNFDGQGVIAILKHPLSLLLICLPFGMVSHHQGWPEVYTFFFNFFAMVPLAKILGDATEELAVALKNDMLAGLLNATFGNAVEMVIMIQTLRAGLYDVVKATLLGSVLSNTLLVLGMSFFCGGIVGTAVVPRATKEGSRMTMTEMRHAETETVWVAEKVQHYSVLNALINVSMLLLSCMCLSLVTVFQTVTDVEGVSVLEGKMLPISRVCSLLIISAYAAYIVFQLGTHREALSEGDTTDEEDGDEEHLSITMSTVIMVICTIVVAHCSEMLVGALEETTRHAHISRHFIGIILLPIVGNACEHAAAVRFAIQDKPGLSIGIAIGSSTQISLFVVPFSVLCGWFMNKDMDLNFGALNTTVMTISVLVVLSMVVDGSSNWLQGYLLCAAYAVVAVLYWNFPDPDESYEYEG
mmetsp:Transcript_56963/g.128030  ORF Transcript_56963/g.128030 Transcript_56963/m.128030 type:complete len:442 (+) Transcript_56963:92-1417(+)